MAWGQRESKGVEDVVQRLRVNEAKLTSLHIFPIRKFGHEEVVSICQALSSNTILKEFYASGRSMTPESAAAVGRMLTENSSLQSICIGDHNFGDCGVHELVQGLRHNSTLQRLDLENKGIGPAGAASIADALQARQQLLSLVLAHNPLTSKGVQALQPGLVRLRELDLTGCAVDAQGATAIANGLKDPHCQLEALHLGDNGFGVEGAKGLAAGLWNCQALRELKLNNTSLGDEGTAALAQALPHATCLTHLDLSCCGIGDDGISDLADAISDPFFGIHDKAALTEEFHGHAPTPAAVRVLKLRGNSITNQGVQELGEALQQSSALQDLDLAGNQVGPEGLQALAPANALQKLCLFNCQLGAEVASQLAASFQHSGFTQLQELDLSGNLLHSADMQCLLESLYDQKAGPALKVLIIGGNPATQAEGFESQVSKAREARQGLDIAWQATDPGQNGSS